MPVKEKIKKYWGLIRQGRFDFVLQAIAWSVPKWLFFYSHSVYLKSDNPNWKCASTDGCELRLARPEDAPLFEPIGTSRDTVLERLGAGERAAILLKNGQLLTAVWAGTSKRFLKYCGTIFDPGPDGAFYYGAFTRAEARRRGYYSATRKYLHETLVREGRRLNWSALSANYPGWVNAVMKFNFAKVGETFFIKLLFVKICYYRMWLFPRGKFNLFFKMPSKDMIWM